MLGRPEKTLPSHGADDEDVEDAEPKPPEKVDAIVDGEGWYVLCGVGATMSGQLVSLKRAPAHVMGNMAPLCKSSRVGVAVWSRAEEISETTRRLRVRASGHPSKHFEGLDDIYADPAATPRVEKANAGAAADVDEVRVLPVYFERDGRRF